MWKWPLHKLCVPDGFGSSTGTELITTAFGGLVLKLKYQGGQICVVMPWWSCFLAFFIWSLNGVGTCCDKVGMAEHLYRVPTHPIKMKGVVYNCSHLYLWYKRIPKELSQLPSLLYIVFFSYVVQKVILYRSNHFVSYVCQVVFFGQSGLSGHWGWLCCSPTALQQLQTLRPGMFGDALLILLTLFIQSWNGFWAVWLEMHFGNLAGWPKNWIEVPSPLSR